MSISSRLFRLSSREAEAAWLGVAVPLTGVATPVPGEEVEALSSTKELLEAVGLLEPSSLIFLKGFFRNDMMATAGMAYKLPTTARQQGRIDE